MTPGTTEPISRRVLRVLHQNSRPVPLGTIAREVGLSLSQAEHLLSKMLREGQVRQAVPPEVEDHAVVAYAPAQASSAQMVGEDREPIVKAPPPRKSRSLKPRVAVDVDGVVADFMTPAIEIVREVTGRPFNPENWTAWDVVESAKLTQAEADECFRRFHLPGFCRGIEPYPTAIEGINRLREVAEVAFLTAPMGMSPFWAFEREHWLRDHFAAKGRIISTDAKDWCAADVLVEDKEKNLHLWLDANPASLALLWARPYNPSPSPRVKVVRSWEDVRAAVEAAYIC